jgi:cbb3-type cytochrome oxidase subunit 1
VDRPVVLFLKAGLVWLVLGVTLGVCMAVHPPLLAWRTAHIHMLLVGFVTGMIFGVGYHVFPRFAGRPLRSPRLVMLHWWLANLGVAAMASGFALRARGAVAGPPLLGVGGAAAALGAYLFVYNVWRTLGSAQAPAVSRPAVARFRWLSNAAMPPIVRRFLEPPIGFSDVGIAS